MLIADGTRGLAHPEPEGRAQVAPDDVETVAA